MRRWPRYSELFDWSQRSAPEVVARTFGQRDWRDLQVLSQLCWMDEEYLARDPEVSRLSGKGSDYTEADKLALQAKQLELLATRPAGVSHGAGIRADRDFHDAVLSPDSAAALR